MELNGHKIMSPLLAALSIWLHALATVVLIGHYLLLSLIYLPSMTTEHGTILGEISKRSRNWLYTSLLTFIITGIHLTLADPNYLGIGNFRNFWGIMMLVKHLLILVMIAMGFWFNAILRVGPLMSSNSGVTLAIARFRTYANLMAISGLLVLLLTALAQAQ
jgi:uncharacterized membrane protein